MFDDWSFLLIFTEPWFLQGIIVNTSFTLASIPFSNKILRKVFRNRKNNRIKNAFYELKIYCMQQIIKDKHINKDDFENQLYIIANRYELEVKDMHIDKNIFQQTLIRSILEVDLIDNNAKEKIVQKIRNDKIFIESDNNNSLNYNHIPSEERDYFDENDYANYNLLNAEEGEYVFIYTSIITGVIFISLFMYTFLCQALINAYGAISLIFLNTIIIVVTAIPMIVNGIIHFTKFNGQNKIFFSFLLLISILNIINFICVVGVLL